MMLNLVNKEGLDPSVLTKKSFRQHQNERNLPKLKNDLAALQKRRSEAVIPNEKAIVEYYETKKQLNGLKREVRNISNQPIYALTFLNPGRLIYIKDLTTDTDWGWGVCVNFQKKKTSADEKAGAEIENAPKYLMDVLLRCQHGSYETPKPWDKSSNTSPDMEIVPMVLDLIEGISSVRIYIPSDLTSQSRRQTVHNTLIEVEKRFSTTDGGIPFLDPIEDLQIDDKVFAGVLRKMETVENKLKRATQFQQISKDDIEIYEQRLKWDEEIKELKKRIRKTEEIILKDELGSMNKFLKKLSYISKTNALEVKGKFAAEINAADEILLTELVFTGFFGPLNHLQIAAVMSCFVFQEKGEGEVTLPNELVAPFKQVLDIAKRVAEVEKQCRLPVDVDLYISTLQPHLIPVVYAWAQGSNFATASGLASVYEGTIIRAMKQEEELLRQMETGCKRIGDSELGNKFREASMVLKRDIVFAASLYL